MKIKRFTLLILTLLFLVVCSTLFINFGVVNTVRFSADVNDKSIDGLRENQLKLAGSIQQLSFSNTNESIGIIKDNAKDSVLIIQNQALNLKSTLNDLNINSFRLYNKEIQEILNKLLNLQIHLDNLYFNLNDSSKNAYSDINRYYSEIERVVIDIKFIYNNLSNKVVEEINLVFNTLIFILIVALFSLSMILTRFTYFLIPTLERKLINLNKNNVQSDHVIYFEEERNIEETLNQQITERTFANDLTKVLLDQLGFDVILDRLFIFINNRLDIDRIGIAYIDYDKETIILIYGQNKISDLKLKVGFELPFVRTSLYDLIESKNIIVNQDLEEQFIQRPKSSSLYYLLQEGIKSNLIYPLIRQNRVYGFLFLSSTQKNFFKEIHIKRTELVFEQIQEVLYKDYSGKIL